VQWEPVALEQAAWVQQRTGLALRERATATLALGPEPHPYRRIRREPSGLTLCVKDWRLRFAVDGRRVRVASVESGVRKSLLNAKGEADAELALHREYYALWR
jgi:tRNA (adenine37-N6)-methyltransferase